MSRGNGHSAGVEHDERQRLLAYISDAEVRELLPDKGFLRDYVEYAATQVTAGLAYHLGCGLAILSATLPADFEIQCITPSLPLVGPMWIMLVGPSGTANKSRAIAVAKKVLGDLGASTALGTRAPMVGPQPASVEGLIDSLAEHQRQIIVYSDFARFLQHTARPGSYGFGLRDRLLEVHDGDSLGDALARGGGRSVENPRLTLLAGIAPAHLEKHTDTTDWDGGFCNRWLLLRAVPEVLVARGVEDRATEDRLHEQLVQLIEAPPGICARFTPAAGLAYDKFALKLFNRNRVSDFFAATTTRGNITAVRAGAIYTISQGGHREGEPWDLDLPALKFGAAIARLYRRGLTWGYTELAMSNYQRTRRGLLAFIMDATIEHPERPAGTRRVSEIHRFLKQPKRDVETLLSSLQDEGLLEASTGAGGSWYRLRSAQEIAVVEGGSTARVAPHVVTAVLAAQGRANSVDGDEGEEGDEGNEEEDLDDGTIPTWDATTLN